MRWLAVLLALLWALPAFAMTPDQGILLLNNPKSASAAPGSPTGLVVNSPDWISTTDLTPVVQFSNGWTGALTLQTTTPIGATSAYNLGTYASPNLSFTDVSPGYNSSAGATTVSRTILATSWLRQTYANQTLPTEAANGGNARISLTFNDFVYSGDSLSGAIANAGLYTGSKARSGIPVTNSSTLAYPRPICAWVTEPGLRVGASGSLTVEMFCGHAYAQGGTPVSAVVFTLGDGTHTVSHTVSSLTASARQWSTPCTVTNGSAQLTSCGSTAGLWVGERMNVPGIPGQPEISALTATTITFGQAATCTATLLGGETIASTPGDGEGLGDGAFAGATISDTNLTTNPAIIVVPVGTGSSSGASTTVTLGAPASGQWAVGMWVIGTNIPAGDYISALGTGTGGAGTYTLHATTTGTVSGNVSGSAIGAAPGATTVTTIHVSTSSAVGVASSNACTINHVYQGSTGTVTATLGNPVPVYSVTFSSSDFSTMSKGLVRVRAQVYPHIGNVVLDSQTGADGTNCDWFYINVNSGVCNGSSAAYFNANGTNISPNLHNLWAYYDADNSYSPIYVPIGLSGTCTTTACISTSNTGMPAAGCTTTCFASAFAAVASIKSYNNNASNRTTVHNDINGAVLCYLAGTTYASWGGAILASITANVPAMNVTSALQSGSCPLPGTYGGDPTNVIITTNGTLANRQVNNVRVMNLELSSTTIVMQGADTNVTTTFPSYSAIFDGVKFVPTGSGACTICEFGAWSIYNSWVDESADEGDILVPLSHTGALQMALGDTVSCGTFTANKAAMTTYNLLGNDFWNCAPTMPNALSTTNFIPQALSYDVAFNRSMGSLAPWSWRNNAVLNNLLLCDNIFEMINQTGGIQSANQISGDSVNVPAANVVRCSNTIADERTNIEYLEGVPQGTAISPTGSGGSLAAGTYFIQFTYALKGNPTVETSTDGPTAGIVVGGTGSDSFSIPLWCDPNYVAYIYIDTSNPPAHYATVTGQAGNVAGGGGIAQCQNVVVTAIGGAATPITVAGSTGHNELKAEVFQRFDIDYQYNMKTDTYSGSGATASGGRVGNWEGRWNVGNIGNIAVTGTAINSGYNPTSALGEIACYLCSSNPANSTTDLSWVAYASDRGFGSNQTDPTFPALNIGEGDYCPANSTHVGSRVPAGYAPYPWDIQGNARKNDGTGWAGAYETGCN